MNTIRVDFPIAEWVWLCEFLAEVLKEDQLDVMKEDTERILTLLQASERGVAV